MEKIAETHGGVRLDLPRPMDPMDEPEAGIESLFEAVCQVDRRGT